MSPPISTDLEPFIPCRRSRGVVLEVRQLDVDEFEIVTIIPGNGAKQGGVITAEALLALSEKLKHAAVFAMRHRWLAVPSFPSANGSHRG
ncbi:MAG: hypothetical protein C0467_30085 [Planctomycetaceae bacterium]|nr:hypothetical protein [Planctomycetaceae bacterium]